MPAPEETVRLWLGREVLLEAWGGRSFRGILRSCDHHMNLVLERVTERTAEGRETTSPMLAVRGDGLLFLCRA